MVDSSYQIKFVDQNILQKDKDRGGEHDNKVVIYCI